MANDPCSCLYSSRKDYGFLPKGSSEISDGGRSDCNQHAKEISEMGKLLSWIVNPGAFMDKMLQLELERV